MKKIKIITTLFFTLFCISASSQNTKSPSDGTVKSAQPSIMVVPHTKEGEDVRHFLDSNINQRYALTKVKEGFDNRNFKTRDFYATLKSALDDHLFTSAQQSDLKTAVIELSQIDIYVEVDVPEMVTSANGNSALLILTAYDASTGISLSNKVCESPKMFTDNYGALITKALGKNVVSSIDKEDKNYTVPCLEDFLNTIQSSFDDIVENGRSIKINFTLSQNAAVDFSTEIKPDGLPFSDVIENWIADNSVKNNYHPPSTTDLRLFFDEVRIPLKDEKGRNYTPNKFALLIFQFLKSKGYNSTKEIRNGTLYITIN